MPSKMLHDIQSGMDESVFPAIDMNHIGTAPV